MKSRLTKHKLGLLVFILLLLILLAGYGARGCAWFTPMRGVKLAGYFADAGHADAQDSRDHGSIGKPWKTLRYAFQQLQPGDTLWIREGTYEEYFVDLTEQNSGHEGAPITVKAYPGETVVLKGDWSISFQGANWWILEGLIFDQPQRQYIQLGLHEALGHDRTVAAEHITIRNCEFKNGTSAVIPIHYANDVLIENNYFHHVRPGTPFYDAQGNQIGWELNAIDVRYMADRIVIRNNRFEEMGSDGVQIGSQSYREGSHIGSVSIINNEFWVNRPYQGILGNVSENAIDIKKVNGPILVSGNIVHGFRPTTPQQDASGADGDGLAIHLDAQNVIVERNLFYDNTMHITVTKNSQNIVIRNNILRDSYPHDHPSAGTGILVYESTGVQILHNTFFNNQNHIKGYSGVVTTGVLKNNVFWRGGFYVPSPGGAWDWDADYNAWSEITGGVPALLSGSHDVLDADLRLDEHFKPTENSPLIDAGTDVGVTDDFARNARSDGTPDMGAREWRWSNLMVHAVHIVPSHIQPK